MKVVRDVLKKITASASKAIKQHNSYFLLGLLLLDWKILSLKTPGLMRQCPGSYGLLIRT
jgi:hypothetical protein